MRIRPIVVVFLLLAEVAAYAQPLEGCYERDTGVDSEFKLGESLTLDFKSRNELEFDIQVVAPSGHLCTAHGVAVREKSVKFRRFRFVRKAGEDRDSLYPNPACSLTINVKAKEITVTSKGECHGYFMCGAQAYVDVQVPRNSWRPLERNDCAMPAP